MGHEPQKVPATYCFYDVLILRWGCVYLLFTSSRYGQVGKNRDVPTRLNLIESIEINTQRWVYMDFSQATELINSLKNQVASKIYGQTALIDEVLTTFLSRGHILLTGAPGLAKTTLVRVIASALKLDFGRIQYTPDLLPSDITGSELLNVDADSGKRYFEFSKGPIFTNLLLADEINRATPRTQSAMLEAMQERKITSAGQTYELSDPFMVFATQNPFESEGTFPLPEAQLDRFLIHSLVDYPDKDAELKMLGEHNLSRLVGEQRSELTSELNLSSEQISELSETASKVAVPEELVEAIAQFVRLTRPEQELPSEFEGAVWYGAGPRAGLSLVSASKAYALIDGSEVVRWSHIKRMLAPVVRHRVKLTPVADRELGGVDKFLESLVGKLEASVSTQAKGMD